MRSIVLAAAIAACHAPAAYHAQPPIAVAPPQPARTPSRADVGPPPLPLAEVILTGHDPCRADQPRSPIDDSPARHPLAIRTDVGLCRDLPVLLLRR